MFTRRLLSALSSRASMGSRSLPRLVPRVTFASSSSSIQLPDNENVKPKSENPEGPMMGGYIEFLDDVTTQTTKMEASVDALKATYDKKREIIETSQTVKWMDAEEIEGLFDVAARQKKEMEEQLQTLKETTRAAQTNYAVNAPDGESDGHFEEELEEVKYMIDHTSTAEARQAAAEVAAQFHTQLEEIEASMDALKETYDKKREAAATATATTTTADEDNASTIKWMDPDEIEGLFDIAGRQKREMQEQLEALKQTAEAAKTNYAVNAPDGENDGHFEEELEEVNYIIDHTTKAAKRAA